MAKVHIYRTYRFIDKDPIIDAVRTVVQSDEHLKNNHVHQISGVATQTLDNWFDGPTRNPRNSTVSAVTTALGYIRHDRIRPDGTLDVRFVKQRELDWGKEIEKQADWVLKHAGPKKKRKQRKKANGNG